MEIKKGQLIAIASGEYSDYYIRDYLRALVDIDTHEVMRLFKSIPLPKGAKPYGRQDDFLAWLQAERIVEPSETNEVIEWHIGSYGELESG